MAIRKVYFFASARYWRYDLDAKQVENGWPKDTATEWRRWPTHKSLAPGADPGDTPSASLNARNGIAYFFFGKEYRRFSVPIDRMQTGALKVATYWHGIDANASIQAAVNLGNDIVCLFHDRTCTRYHLVKDQPLDGYPKRIVDDWPGMPDAPIDAALNCDDGSLYFFVDKRFVRFDLGLNQAVMPFQSIAGYWHGMPDERIDDAIEWSEDDRNSAVVPIYDPSFWNDDLQVQICNNCYSYACNRDMHRIGARMGRPWRPGFGSGHPVPLPANPGQITSEALKVAAVADGLVPIDPDRLVCPSGQYPVMMFRNNKESDFHFVRRDADGRWSHKVGESFARNTDDKGNLITDPRSAIFNSYPVFVGAFSVDRSVVRLGG